MNNKLKPALIGGVVVGVLSSIPFVNFVNVCCCLWAVLGGVLASYLYVKSSANPVGAGEGAILGVLAGIVGAAIYVVIGIPITLIMGSVMTGVISNMMESLSPGQAEAIRRQMEASQSPVGAILNGIFTAVLLVIFATLGGLLGIPIFEKRKTAAGTPPPPPQNFGGGPGSYGSAM
jgi:hypothetical protein